MAEDHPRVCGEKYKSRTLKMQFTGSPPRMRGKAHEQPGVGTPFLITPAYAGKSPEN